MVPEKRGMGSSAAVSIAAIRAVFDYYQEELDEETLEILVNRAETIAQRNRNFTYELQISVTNALYIWENAEITTMRGQSSDM